MNYNDYKEQKEAEFKEYSEKNTFYAYYPFEVERELKRLRATINEFTNVGASYFYVRTTALGTGEEIRAKYDNIFKEEIATNDTFLYEFLIDEFTRIKAFNGNKYNEVFEYNNMDISTDDLTAKQLEVYEKAIADYKEINKEDIKIYEDYFKARDDYFK